MIHGIEVHVHLINDNKLGFDFALLGMLGKLRELQSILIILSKQCICTHNYKYSYKYLYFPINIVRMVYTEKKIITHAII